MATRRPSKAAKNAKVRKSGYRQKPVAPKKKSSSSNKK